MVSVISPTYNRSDNIVRLIHSVDNSTYPDIEMIVVDNASTDDTEERVRETAAQCGHICVHYIKSAYNRNASGGRSYGVSFAKGTYYLFIDDDNEIDSGMIEELIFFAENHQNAGLIAPVSVIASHPEYASTLGCGINLVTSKAIFRYAPIRLSEIDHSIEYPTTAATNSFMVTKDAYMAAGGWDEKLGIMYDETDLGLRIAKAGYQEYYCVDALCTHYGATFPGESDTLRGLGIGTPERAFTFARNRSIVMRRYAPWYGKILYYAFFIHLFSWYYTRMARKCGRMDIAEAYRHGVTEGKRVPVYFES